MKRHYLFLLLAGLLGFAIAYGVTEIGVFDGLSRRARDWQLRAVEDDWRPPELGAGWGAPGGRLKVVVVAVDARTITTIAGGSVPAAPGGSVPADDDTPNAPGRSPLPVAPARWPFPPVVHLALARQLKVWGARGIGWDIPIPTARQGQGGAAFDAQALLDLGASLPLVFATRLGPDGLEPRAPGVSGRAGAIEGLDNLPQDTDEYVRRYWLTGDFLDAQGARWPSLAYALVRAGEGIDALARRGWATDDGEPVADEVLIAYRGRELIPVVSYLDVLLGKVPQAVLDRYGCASAAELFGGRAVLVGVTRRASHERFKTPYFDPDERTTNDDPATRESLFPGVLVHANAAQMLSEPRSAVDLRAAAALLDVQVLVVVCLVMVLAVALLPPLFSFAVLAAVIAGVIYGGIAWLRAQHVFLSLAPPVFGALITFTVGSAAGYLTERREKRFIKALFGKYLARSVVDQLSQNPKLAKLGGDQRELTILFVDIANFTAWAERFGPAELLRRLNEYFTAMSAEILGCDGTLDKFLGDGIMAFWNAPVPRKEHAADACRAALAMRQALERLNARWRDQGLRPLYMRIGIHTGDAIVGNAGSDQRFDYTAIGDAVNLASRLEGTAKFYGVNTVISEATYRAVDKAFAVRLIDKVRVKGRTEPVAMYELVGTAKQMEKQTEQHSFLDAFHAGITHYFERSWPRAREAFQTAQSMRPEDGPTRVFLARCQRFSRDSPPANWDGSIELTRKE